MEDGHAFGSSNYGIEGQKDIFFNRTPLLQPTASLSPSSSDYNFNVEDLSLETKNGTASQAVIKGFSKVRSTVSAFPNDDLTNAGDFKTLSFTDTSAARVSQVVVIVGIPSLFAAFNNGDIRGLSLRYQIFRSVDGGSNFQEVKSVLVKGRTNDLYQIQKTINIPDAPDANARTIAIKVAKFNALHDDPNIVQQGNSVRFMSIVKVIEQSPARNYPNTALVGLKIDAENFSNVPTRSYFVKGIKIRIPSGVNVDINTGRIEYPTNYVFNNTMQSARFCACPVFVLYDILTNKRYGLGEQILTPAEKITFNGVAKNIDLFSFVDASKYANTLVSDRRTNTTLDSNGNPVASTISGTYVQTGTKVVITFSANSGFQKNDLVTLDYTTGLATDATSKIKKVQQNKTVIIIKAGNSLSTNGNVTVTKGGTEPRFSFNGVINRQDDAFRLLNKVASNFRGSLYFDEGKLKIVCDKPQDPVYLFNRSNVTAEGFTYEGSDVKTRSNSVIVKFFNNVTQQIDYVQHPPTVTDTENDPFVKAYGLNKKQIDAFGCTSAGQASRLARFIYYSENFLTETCTFSITSEAGVMLKVGMVISISDPVRSGTRLAGRITASTISSITVDSISGISFSSGDKLFVIMPDGQMAERTVTGISGSVISVNFNFAVGNTDTAPNINSVWLYEKTTAAPSTWRVIAIEQEQNLVYSVTAVSYNESLYNQIEGGIDVEGKDITTLDEKVESPSSLTITESLYKHVPNKDTFATNNGNIRVQLRVTWDTVFGAVKYKVVYTKGTTNNNSASFKSNNNFGSGVSQDNPVDVIVRRNEFELRNVDAGSVYDFEVQSINAGGLLSAVPVTASQLVIGKDAPPSDVQNLSSEIDPNDGVGLNWIPVVPVQPNFADLDLAGYEIRKQNPSDSNFSAATHPETGATNLGIRVQATSLFLPVEFVKQTSTFLVKAYDTSGNFSDNAASETVTISNPSVIQNVVTTAENGLIKIRWDAPATATYKIKNYKITFNDGSAKTIFADSTEFQTPAAWTNGNRVFTIRAVDIADNEGTGTNVTVTIPQPAAPTSLTKSFNTDTCFLKWNEPASAGSLQPPVIGYRIYRNNDFNNSIGQVKGTSFGLVVNSTNFPNVGGTAQASYQVAAVYADPAFPVDGKPSTNRASITISIGVAPAPSPSFSFELDFVKVVWNEVNGDLKTIRYGIFEGTTLLGVADSREFMRKADFDTKTIQIKAFSAAYINAVGDAAAQALFIGTGANFTITRQDLVAPQNGAFVLGSEGGLGFVTSSWTPPNVNPAVNLDLKDFKIIRSSSATFAGINAGNTELTVIQDTDSFKEEVTGEVKPDGTIVGWRITGNNDSITRYYYIIPRDLLDNEGAHLKIPVEIFRPSAVPTQGTSEVIDNNVLLRWGEPAVNATNQLKIDHYEIRKHTGSGSASQVWSTSLPIGKGTGKTITDSRFSVLFETVAGTFTYLIKAKDTAGNETKDNAIFFVSLAVSQPPDFVLNADYDSVFRTAFGTYSQSGTTVTVTLTEHRFEVGDLVTLFPSSGTAVGDAFTDRPVTSVANANTFTVTSFVSKTTSGNVTVKTITGLTEPQEVDSVAFTNCLKVFDVALDRNVIYLPVLTNSSGEGTQTWAEHFVGNGSNASPQFANITAIINAGLTDYLEPAPIGDANKGIYQEVFDYGTQLASSKVSSLATFANQGNGTVNQSQRLDLASNDSGGTFSSGTESNTNAASRFGVDFRRVRYNTSATSVGGSLTKITNLNLKVDVKIKNDTGKGNVAPSLTGSGTYSQSSSTTITINISNHGLLTGCFVTLDFTSGGQSDSGDGEYLITKVDNNSFTVQASSSGSSSGNVSFSTTGTPAYFNVDFVDIQGINVTPNATTAVIAVVDFKDIPNPKSFQVLFFDPTTGNRVTSGTTLFTWQCRGT